MERSREILPQPSIPAIIAATEDEITIRRRQGDGPNQLVSDISKELPALGLYLIRALSECATPQEQERLSEIVYIVYEVATYAASPPDSTLP